MAATARKSESHVGRGLLLFKETRLACGTGDVPTAP